MGNPRQWPAFAELDLTLVAISGPVYPEGSQKMSQRKIRPRILICEDEILIAIQIATLVEECGCEAVGPFAWGRDALSYLKHQTIDAAILDIELLDGASTPLARVLREAGGPMIVLSGLRANSPPPEFAGVEWLTKPADENRLRAFLKAVAVNLKATNMPLPPEPIRFRAVGLTEAQSTTAPRENGGGYGY